MSVSPRARRLLTGVSAGLATTALVALSAAPGVAAGPVAQATATGLVLTIASTPTDSGTYAVSNDGRTETSSGTDTPALSVLTDQGFASAGTLAQDATTSVDRRGRGSSAACAGLAGDGASLVAVEDGGGCLTPGQNLTLEAGSLDFADVNLVGSDLFMGVEDQVRDALSPVLNPLLGALNDGIDQFLLAAGDPGLFLDIGAIQSQCTAAAPSAADGDTQITDASLFARFPGINGDITLVELPVDPDPNQKVVTDLDGVVDALNDGLNTQFQQAFGGALAPLGVATDAIIQQLNANVVAAVSDQLGPVEENLLDITLNKQERSPGAIAVTALDLSVLPAAEDFGVDLLSAEIGRSTCGPSGRFVPADPEDPTDPGTPPAGTPAVPTFVPAGQDSSAAARTDDGGLNDTLALLALGGLAAVAGAAGVATYRRTLR